MKLWKEKERGKDHSSFDGITHLLLQRYTFSVGGILVYTRRLWVSTPLMVSGLGGRWSVAAWSMSTATSTDYTFSSEVRENLLLVCYASCRATIL